MKPVRNEYKTKPSEYADSIQQLVLVSMPPGSHIKEIIIRHPMAYDFATQQFKIIQLPTLEEIERHAAETTSDIKSWLASANGANWLKSKLQ